MKKLCLLASIAFVPLSGEAQCCCPGGCSYDNGYVYPALTQYPYSNYNYPRNYERLRSRCRYCSPYPYNYYPVRELYYSPTFNDGSYCDCNSSGCHWQGN